MKRRADRRYNKNFHPEEYVRLSSEGKHISEICSTWGVCRDTVYQWGKKHKIFAGALKKGFEAREAWWIKLGRQAIMGGKATVNGKEVSINIGMFVWLTKNILHWHDGATPQTHEATKSENMKYVAKWGGHSEEKEPNKAK